MHDLLNPVSAMYCHACHKAHFHLANLCIPHPGLRRHYLGALEICCRVWRGAWRDCRKVRPPRTAQAMDVEQGQIFPPQAIRQAVHGCGEAATLERAHPASAPQAQAGITPPGGSPIPLTVWKLALPNRQYPLWVGRQAVLPQAWCQDWDVWQNRSQAGAAEGLQDCCSDSQSLGQRFNNKASFDTPPGDSPPWNGICRLERPWRLSSRRGRPAFQKRTCGMRRPFPTPLAWPSSSWARAPDTLASSGEASVPASMGGGGALLNGN